VPADPIEEAVRQWGAHDLPESAAMAAATSIMRAQQIIETAVDRTLRPLDLTFARYEVLMLLSFARGALPMTKMGDRLMIHPTGVTKLVDKLERQGLVERRPNPSDRRGTLAHITPSGRALARRATKALAASRFGADLGPQQLRAIVDSVKALRAATGDL
jgi:DNA-binding MarR family transcriptional regulator